MISASSLATGTIASTSVKGIDFVSLKRTLTSAPPTVWTDLDGGIKTRTTASSISTSFSSCSLTWDPQAPDGHSFQQQDGVMVFSNLEDVKKTNPFETTNLSLTSSSGHTILLPSDRDAKDHHHVSLMASTNEPYLFQQGISSDETDNGRVKQQKKRKGGSRSPSPTFVASWNSPRDLLEQLSDDEREIAARSSYQYLLVQQNQHTTKEQERDFYALQMIQRYWDAKKGNGREALKKLHKTLQFRREMGLDDLRLAFVPHTGDDSTVLHPMLEDVSSTTATAGRGGGSSLEQEGLVNNNLGEELRNRLASRHVYVQGVDKEGRATYVFRPRCVKHHDPLWTIREAMYTMERAIASTERHQATPSAGSRQGDKGEQGTSRPATINAILDFAGFSISMAPPMDVGKQFISCFRDHYPNQIHSIFVVDAPSSFRMLWTLFQPFVSSATKSKIQFVSGNQQKHQVFGQFYEKEQAADWMLPGEGQNNAELNVDEYLYQTPFDQAWGNTFLSS